MKNRIALALLLVCTVMFSLASSCEKEPHGPTPEDEDALIVRYGLSNCYLVDTVSTSISFDVKAYPVYAKNHITASKTEDTQAVPAASVQTIWIEDGFTFDAPTISDKVVTVSNFSGYGNGLVGIYDADGNLLWSYHIWRPKDDPTQVLRFASMGAYVMPMALGATEIWDGEPVVSKRQPNYAATAGLYYQWGRKDPLGRPGAITGSTEQNYWDASGTLITPFGSSQSVSIDAALADYTGDVADETNAAYQPTSQFMQNYARKNPTTFVWVTEKTHNNDWADETNNFFWGNYRASGSFPRMNKTYKSIFDPCPQGYRVPPEDTWVGFTTTKTNTYGATSYPEWNMANNGPYDSGTNMFEGNVTSNDTYKLDVARGYAFYYQGYGTGNTDFYPASGYRDRGTSGMYYVGTACVCWGSAPNGASASRMFFSSSNIHPVSAHERGYGFSVRCVKEPTQ